jgi:hypothetical protein
MLANMHLGETEIHSDIPNVVRREQAIMRFIEKVRKYFRKEVVPMNTHKVVPVDLGDALLAPAPAARKAIVPLSEPVSVVPQPIMAYASPAPASLPAVCPACGQLMPEKIAEPVVVGPSPLDAEWNELENMDLPPRTQPQIASLIAAGETPEQRTHRIVNDRMRYARSQGR